MKYLTEKEFEKEMTQIKQQKRQYEMKKELREAKRRFPKFKKPRTSIGGSRNPHHCGTLVLKMNERDILKMVVPTR